ncbi:MAG: hypothetical protein ACXACU_15445 [Candidatus Hodarchaeales archaeon]|jgi:septal ring factor EnvC (AmiA/AmiB activator)
MQKEREVEIETLKTPKGDVVTIKGLETAINSVYKEIASLDQHLAQVNTTLNQISSNLSDYSQKIGSIGESLASLLVYIAKLETQQGMSQEFIKKQETISRSDLSALKEELSRILEQIQNAVTKSER